LVDVKPGRQTGRKNVSPPDSIRRRSRKSDRTSRARLQTQRTQQEAGRSRRKHPERESEKWIDSESGSANARRSAPSRDGRHVRRQPEHSFTVSVRNGSSKSFSRRRLRRTDVSSSVVEGRRNVHLSGPGIVADRIYTVWNSRILSRFTFVLKFHISLDKIMYF